VVGESSLLYVFPGGVSRSWRARRANFESVETIRGSCIAGKKNESRDYWAFVRSMSERIRTRKTRGRERGKGGELGGPKSIYLANPRHEKMVAGLPELGGTNVLTKCVQDIIYGL